VLTDLLHRNPRELGALIECGHLLRKRGDHTGSAEAFEAAD
jgi:hypothetical protein